MNRKILDEIIQYLDNTFEPLGFECIECEWNSHDELLRVYIDNLIPQELNLDVEACAKASRALNEDSYLDDLFTSGYRLEVSSPGLERPLRKLSQFKKYVGEQIEVKLTNRKNGKQQTTNGLLHSVLDKESDDQEEIIVLMTEEGEMKFPISSVFKANLIFKWGS